MSSPHKRARRPQHGGSSRLSEPSLPLHIALAWLAVKVFPLNPAGEPTSTYSASFTATVLRVIAREILEVRFPQFFPRQLNKPAVRLSGDI